MFLNLEFNPFHLSLHIFQLRAILDLVNVCTSLAILSHFCVAKNICECGSTQTFEMNILLFFAFDECKYLSMIPIALLLACGLIVLMTSADCIMIGDVALLINTMVASIGPT
jgi:hypothetical protein